MASSVDLSNAVRFDLPSGNVHLSDNEKGLLVPASVLASLLQTAPPDVRGQVGRDLGAHLGRAMARRAGSASALLEGGLEAAASALAAELALAGLGTCALERWGRALVVQVTGSPIEASDFMACVVEGALMTATGRSLACTVLSDAGGVRVLVASERGVLRVRGWIEQGVSWSDALVRLQAGGGS
jgi:hypothetical protein